MVIQACFCVAHGKLSRLSDSVGVGSEWIIQGRLGPKIVLLACRIWIWFTIAEYARQRHGVLGRDVVEELENELKSSFLVLKFVSMWSLLDYNSNTMCFGSWYTEEA